MSAASSAKPKGVIEKQGIVSILGSDCDQRNYYKLGGGGGGGAAASLRRTLSADMSSKKWLAQNGFCPMKKIASSEELHVAINSSSSSSSSEDQDDEIRPGQDEVWRSIQSQKEKNNINDEKLQAGWSWGSILTDDKKNDGSKDDDVVPPPYIHPLVKRSTSSLSEKSLKICTESLGSETGSDGFSSYAPSETDDVEEDKDCKHQQQRLQLQSSSFFEEEEEDLEFVKYNYSLRKKIVPPRSFPPPLPSLARQDGASLHMHCHRQDGRLVLEAVSIPSKNYFQAQRQDGRLVLTLVRNPSSSEEVNRDEEIQQEAEEVEEYTRVFDNIEEIDENEAQNENDGYVIEEEEEEEEEEEQEEEEEIEMEEKFEKENGQREMEFVHKSALMMRKNLTWSPKFNKAVNLTGAVDEEATVVVMVEEDELSQLPQSLPPPPRVARLISAAPPTTAASFNAYQYLWREKPSMASIIKPNIQEQCTVPLKNNNLQKNKTNLKGYNYEQQNLVVMRGNKADSLLMRCKEPRRSLSFWEPHCIATS